MVVRKKKVSMIVDRDFFEKMFEPSRRRIEGKLGVRVSQVNFTRMLLKSNMDLNPKLNFNLNDDIKLKKLKVRRNYGIKKINKRK